MKPSCAAYATRSRSAILPMKSIREIFKRVAQDKKVEYSDQGLAYFCRNGISNVIVNCAPPIRAICVTRSLIFRAICLFRRSCRVICLTARRKPILSIFNLLDSLHALTDYASQISGMRNPLIFYYAYITSSTHHLCASRRVCSCA